MGGMGVMPRGTGRGMRGVGGVRAMRCIYDHLTLGQIGGTQFQNEF